MFDNGKGHITVNDLKSILYSSFSMSAAESEKLFKKIDTKGDGLITYGKQLLLKVYFFYEVLFVILNFCICSE